jgi:hypothetical protein
MLQAGRTKNAGGYRFGFQGQEADNKIGGLGQHTTAQFWEYDTWAVKRWNMDPLSHKLPEQSPYNFCLNNPILFMDIDGDYPIITITKKKTGKTTLQRVIGYTGSGKKQYTNVDLYQAVVTDTEDKNFKMTFSVTRDAFAVKEGDASKELLKMTNLAFEPKDDDINLYTGKIIEYPRGDGTKALKLTQDDSEVVHADPNQASVDLDFRTKADIASGVMIHVGGTYQHSDGSTSCAASEGCFGITDGNSSSSNPSNNYSNTVLNEIINQANKSKTNKGKIIIEIHKRSNSERPTIKIKKKNE